MEPFAPPRWIRNSHLQTVLGSLRIRTAGRNEMVEASREVIVDGGVGVRLLGYHARTQDGDPRGLIVLLHGWEGSADSAYMLSTGRFLFRLGYDIFRLNLRDHGKSHHLNRGLFHGALTDETTLALRSIAALRPNHPCYLVGFSLGGNFALRIALRAPVEVPCLRHVYCISPALDPYRATLAIDRSLPVYRRYFLNKWKRSLREKQRCFPDLYRFDDILHHRTVMALTEAIMPYFTQFSSYRDYFSRYTLTGNALAALKTPTTIFAALDDPVIPSDDLQRLSTTECLHLSLQRHGGHCGFFDKSLYHSWCDRRIADELSQENRA